MISSQIGRWLLTWCGWFAKFQNYNAITLYGHFGKPGSSEAIAWTMALVQSEDAPHTRHPSFFSIIWIENIWNNWMLILLEWAVVAQCPCDPAAALLLESRRGARRKKSRRGHLCSTLLYAGWPVHCSMFSYLNTIQYNSTIQIYHLMPLTIWS